MLFFSAWRCCWEEQSTVQIEHRAAETENRVIDIGRGRLLHYTYECTHTSSQNTATAIVAAGMLGPVSAWPASPVESLNLRPTVLASGCGPVVQPGMASTTVTEGCHWLWCGHGAREGLDRGLVRVKAVTVGDLHHQQSVPFHFGLNPCFLYSLRDNHLKFQFGVETIYFALFNAVKFLQWFLKRKDNWIYFNKSDWWEFEKHTSFSWQRPRKYTLVWN